MTKILIIHNIIAPYRLPLFEGIANSEISLKVHYCTERYNDRKWKIIQENKNYESKILRGFTFKVPFLNIPSSINPSVIRNIIRSDYDVIIINGFTDITNQLALFGSILRKKKVILWSELTGSFLSDYGKIYKSVIKFFMKYPDAIIVPSTASKEFHINMGVLPESVFLSPNVIDNIKYSELALNYKKDRTHIKREFGIDHRKVILFVGRLIKRKNVNLLIEAYENLSKKMDDICLVIVGDGPSRDYLADFVYRNGIKNIYFQGFLEENDIIKYYSISDVLVLPSSWELHPLVLSEAMACGCPVITTKKVFNALDMIENGKNGFVIEQSDLGQLERFITYTLNESESMGEAAMKTLNTNFSLKKSIDGFFSAIKYVRY